jgi:hypothetical protein
MACRLSDFSSELTVEANSTSKAHFEYWYEDLKLKKEVLMSEGVSLSEGQKFKQKFRDLQGREESLTADKRGDNRLGAGGGFLGAAPFLSSSRE